MHKQKLPNVVLNSLLFGVVSIAGFGCSLLVDVSTNQCEQDSDCSSLSPGSQCVASICSIPAVTADAAEMTRFSCRNDPWKLLDNNVPSSFTLSVLSLSTSLPFPDLVIHECNSLFDQNCKTPVATETTDETGTAVFDVPQGFRGHFFAPATASSAATIVHAFPPPDPDNPLSLHGGLNTANLSEIAAAAGALGIAIVPDTGVYLYTAFDCFGELLPGVQVSVSPKLQETTAAYISTSGVPDPNLVSTGPAGSGAVVNLPTGYVTIKAVHEEMGTIFEQSVLVLPNASTASRILPSP